jgi:DnaJ-class molecular chaperone
MDILLIEALCGFDRKFRHLNGDKIRIRSDTVIKSNEKKTLHGLGFCYNGQNGNLHINFNIIYPNNLCSEKQLSKILNQNSKRYDYKGIECNMLSEYQPVKEENYNKYDHDTNTPEDEPQQCTHQ